MIGVFVMNVWASWQEWKAHRRYQRACYGLTVSHEVIAKLRGIE